jgi:hypothetical protein
VNVNEVDRPPPIALPRWLPSWARILLLTVGVALVCSAGYLGATHQPDVAPPEGAKAEQRIAGEFGMPKPSDGVLRGDLMIERFYTYDVETGQREVAVLCKGRVTDISEVTQPDGTGRYTIVVDRKDLQREADRIAAFVAATAPYQGDQVKDLGLKVQAGDAESLRLNYDGRLPKRYSRFTGPRREDVYTFLSEQSYAGLTSARLVGVKGTNYLLSSTGLFPYFRSEFATGQAVIISEFVFIDLTSPAQTAAYRDISQKIPARP